MTIQKIYIGGWFQRTTLHLTEIWDFMHHSKSRLDFSEEELRAARESLALKEVTRESGPLEYLQVKTTSGIDYRIYEDGLMVLEKEFEILESDFESIKDYYDNRLSPALSLIFSQGAPVPKELVNIQTILPYIVTVTDATREEAEQLFTSSSEEIYSVTSTDRVEVYRSPGLILINNLEDHELARTIIESQIFFREFKSQLHRYLTIHRTIWEKIQIIKERKNIRGTEVDPLRNELSVYEKTVNLIEARIHQMPAYAKTRQRLTNLEKVDPKLQPLFQSKFETLLDTHEYVKYLWDMTQGYLSSTIELFTELQTKSTKNTISSLQLITTVGVVAGIFGYLSRDTFPTFTSMGLAYFLILLAATWIVNTLVSYVYKSRRYPLEDKEVEKNIR